MNQDRKLRTDDQTKLTLLRSLTPSRLREGSTACTDAPNVGGREAHSCRELTPNGKGGIGCHGPLLALIKGMLHSADANLIDEIAARVWYALVANDGALSPDSTPAAATASSPSCGQSPETKANDTSAPKSAAKNAKKSPRGRSPLGQNRRPTYHTSWWKSS